jgi:hypothetical protein
LIDTVKRVATKEHLLLCTWKPDKGVSNWYHTDCGGSFMSVDVSLDKDMKHCCYCGRLLKEEAADDN